ncbi:uncharacterized protein METZ01_LOCUS310204, partial [marine metagenome]
MGECLHVVINEKQQQTHMKFIGRLREVQLFNRSTPILRHFVEFQGNLN